jgi:hypothetical protein
MLIGGFALISSAQSNNKRIQFARGKTSAVEKFTLPGDDGITYILRVKKGNLIRFTVTGMYTNGADAQGLTITLTEMGSEAPLAEASPGEEVEHEFDSSGDYVITIMNPGTRRARTTLKVTIDP